MKRRLAVVVALALAVALAAPSIGSAQVQTSTELTLLQRANLAPNDISALLDLAKLYFTQQRFEEAIRTLQRAQTVVDHERLFATNAQAAGSRTLITSTGAARPVTPTSSMLAAEWQRAVKIGGDVKEPTKIQDVPAVYPEVAKAAKITGYVIIEVLVGADGRVHDTRVIKPHPLLQDAAVDAVRQWVYAPTIVNGAAVPVIMSATVQFTLR